MVYDFILKETKTATVPVMADSKLKAQAIFDEWYEKHTSDPKDTTIYDMMDDGSGGIEITRAPGKPDSCYNPEDILLPEEQPVPQEPKYDLYITFGETNCEPETKRDLSIHELFMFLSDYGYDYYLFPDAPVKAANGRFKPLMLQSARRNCNDSVWIRAILK